MKKYSLFIYLFILGISLFAQQNPTGNPPTNPNNPSQTAQSAWYRGGNQPVSTGSNNNIFGTNWNSPIYTVTEGVIRTKLNGRLITNINGVNQDVTGYFGIGLNGYFANNTPIAMLHLEGTDNTNTPGIGSFGWRSWMQTGLYMRENSDAMYVGMQNQPGTTNRSDAVINWNDDGGDRLKIVMTT